MTDSSDRNEIAFNCPRTPAESEDFPVSIWIDKIIHARKRGRFVGDLDKYYTLDELKNPSRSDNEQFARMYVELSELRDLMKSQFTACAMRMSAHEIATGASDRHGSIGDNVELLRFYGLKPVETAKNKFSRQEIIFNRLIELESCQIDKRENVRITVKEIMNMFDLGEKNYSTAREIMKNTEKKYPNRVKFVAGCQIGIRKMAVIELLSCDSGVTNL